VARSTGVGSGPRYYTAGRSSRWAYPLPTDQPARSFSARMTSTSWPNGRVAPVHRLGTFASPGAVGTQECSPVGGGRRVQAGR